MKKSAKGSAADASSQITVKAATRRLHAFERDYQSRQSAFQGPPSAAETQELAAVFGVFQEAAEKGDPLAQAHLGYMHSKGLGLGVVNEEMAFQWNLKAAKSGDSNGQVNLAFLYKQGKGVKQSDKEAVKWYLEAAKQENPHAQNNLAFMYSKGRGVAQSFDEAVRWYQRAADNGFEPANANLIQAKAKKATEDGPLIRSWVVTKSSGEKVQACLL